jgi:Ca-activated chloride channel family protein
MHFGNPQVLWLLFLWLVLVILGVRTLAWRARVARRIGQPELVERLYPAEVRLWRRRRLALTLAALLFLIIAAARPQYGRIERTMRSVGTNVLIAVDCSKSMDADDVKPSRIEAARRSLGMLLHRLTGNRVGILAFAGEAFLACPMTLDQEMAGLVLQSLDTDAVGVQGTDIGAAIETATGAFERGAPEGGRALVLLTDGEDLEGHAIEAARQAKAKGVHVYAIGIGTAQGTPLLEKKEGNTGGFKDDPNTGKKVNTRLQMQTLDQIASITGGKAFAADDAPGAAVDHVSALIESLAKSDLEARKQVLFQDRCQWFLAPALLLILCMMLMRPTPTRPGGKVPEKPAQPQTTAVA